MKEAVKLVTTIWLACNLMSGIAEAQVQALTIPDERERNDMRTHSTFGEDQKLLEHIVQRWLEGRAWGNQRRHVYTREDDDRTVIQTILAWEGGSWTNAAREIETYDANNNLTSRTHEIWDQSWVPKLRDVYMYNELQRMTEWRNQVRTEDGTWNHHWRFTFLYNQNGDLTERTYQEWVNNRWNVVRRATQRFNNAGNPVEKTVYQFRSRDLVPDVSYLYVYDEEERLTELAKRGWTGAAWQNIEAEQYAYDDAGELAVIEYIETSPGNERVLRARDRYISTAESDTSYRIRETRNDAGEMEETWQYLYIRDFRGNNVGKSFMVRREDAWVEQYRTIFTYDLYGNQTSSVTQR
jgi:hypothetical protein